MKKNLSPLAGKPYQRFILNGVEERIITVPKERSGNVVFTMGGKTAFAEKLSIENFEDQTGYYIIGLEPEFEFNIDKTLRSLKKDLEKLDYTINESVSENKGDNIFILSASIHFATKKNVHVEGYFHIAEYHDRYAVRVSRNAGYGTNRHEEFSGAKGSLPLLINSALECAKKYNSTRVQIMSSEAERGERAYSKDGFPILFKNESLSEYFKSQDMPAGIVINNAGEYQAFHSYMSFEKKRVLSHETNSFKSIKSASKLLEQHGFDTSGKFLNTLNPVAFKEAFHEYTKSRSHYELNSWSDDVVYYLDFPGGFGSISNLAIHEDEKLGFKYSLDFEYIEEKTGRRFLKSVALEPDMGNAVGSALSAYYEFYKETYVAYNEGVEIDFQPDLRSIAEKKNFHFERCKLAQGNLERYDRMISQSSNPDELRTSWSKVIDIAQSRIEMHQKAYKELSKEIRLEADSSVTLH